MSKQHNNKQEEEKKSPSSTSLMDMLYQNLFGDGKAQATHPHATRNTSTRNT